MSAAVERLAEQAADAARVRALTTDPDVIALRGTVATGFRAPTPGQVNPSSIATGRAVMVAGMCRPSIARSDRCPVRSCLFTAARDRVVGDAWRTYRGACGFESR